VVSLDVILCPVRHQAKQIIALNSFEVPAETIATIQRTTRRAKAACLDAVVLVKVHL
jgi:hypothetical protein